MCVVATSTFQPDLGEIANSLLGHGLQGFQTPIQDESFIVEGVGSFGNMHTERGFNKHIVLFYFSYTAAYMPY